MYELSTYARAVRCIMRASMGKGRACLREKLRIPHGRILISILRINKCIDFASHLQSCRTCKKFVDTSTYKHLRQVLRAKRLVRIIRHMERAKLQKILISERIVACDYKESPSGLLEQNGSDIDILVSKIDAQKLHEWFVRHNYQVINYPPKEVTYEHSVTGIRIDVHTLIAYPNYGDLDPREKQALIRFTNRCLKETRANGYGLHALSPEIYICSLCIMYLYNDMCKGVRYLYQLHTLFSVDEYVIDWKKIEKLLHDYRLLPAIRFIGVVLRSLYGTSMPVQFQPNIIERILGRWFTLPRLLYEYPVNEWHSSEHQKSSGAWYRVYAITRSLLGLIPYRRLLRPRYIIFFISMFIEGISGVMFENNVYWRKRVNNI